MYQFLRARLPVPLARTIMAAWYLALIVIVIYFSFEPKAEFNYLNV